MNKKQLLKTLKENKLDVIYSTSPQTRLWLTGLDSSAGFLFLEKTSSKLFIDGRYFEVASKTAKNTKVELFTKFAQLVAYAKSKGYKRIGVEKEYLTIGELAAAKKIFPKATFVNISAAELRIIKDAKEVEIMKVAGRIAIQAITKLKKYIKPGVTEIELNNRLRWLLTKYGAYKESFDAIVVSGPRGSLPHGNPSNRKLQKGEMVTIDFGAIYKGYASDVTKTFVVGKLTDPKLIEIRDIVTEAQRLGKEAVKPGINSGDIDKICRDYITEKGYGKYFVTSTGHGLGIDVHELPNVSANPLYSRLLEPGMVITVEPGIYIPGVGGIRIEDDVLVTKNGYEVLSSL